MAVPYPFSAIVAQDGMKQALLLAVVDPSLGGVMVFGDRGTGKSTAVRGLAALLPRMAVVKGCPYGCDPEGQGGACEACRAGGRKSALGRRYPWWIFLWGRRRIGSWGPWIWKRP